MGLRKPRIEPAWPTCADRSEEACIGIRIPGGDRCLRHLKPDGLDSFLGTLEPGSRIDVRGTRFDQHLLGRLLDAFAEEGKARLGEARFDGATFEGGAWFEWATFEGDTSFGGAAFDGGAYFESAAFAGAARFSGASFGGVAAFGEATFAPDAWFGGASFGGDASFGGAAFGGDAWFDRTTFGGDAAFGRTTFDGGAWFEGAAFEGDARFPGAAFGVGSFSGVTFRGDAWFDGATFKGDAWFDGATFSRAARLGPVCTARRVVVTGATFEQAVVVEVLARGLECMGAKFLGGVALRCRYAEIALDGADFPRPSIIGFPPPFTELSGEAPFQRDGRPARPTIVSLRRVDATNLTVSDVHLHPCLFQGAHHLDRLRIEGPPPFENTPGASKLSLGKRRVPVWRRWTRRQALGEEHAWRRSRSPSDRKERRWLDRPEWYPPRCRPPDWLQERTGQAAEVLGPERLAALYRALRKAQEDSKNEPGAADLYYGEMEMRRLSPGTSWGEKVILYLYWAISGYGLRGLRSLAWLAALIAALAFAFDAFGFQVSPGEGWSLADSLLYAARSTLSIEGSAPDLTRLGQLGRIALRLGGPLLLGLTLLAVRNRVRR